MEHIMFLIKLGRKNIKNKKIKKFVFFVIKVAWEILYIIAENWHCTGYNHTEMMFKKLNYSKFCEWLFWKHGNIAVFGTCGRGFEASFLRGLSLPFGCSSGSVRRCGPAVGRKRSRGGGGGGGGAGGGGGDGRCDFFKHFDLAEQSVNVKQEHYDYCHEKKEKEGNDDDCVPLECFASGTLKKTRWLSLMLFII